MLLAGEKFKDVQEKRIWLELIIKTVIKDCDISSPKCDFFFNCKL
jgi:hypothetical protein